MMHFHQAPHVYVEQVALKVQDLERALQFYQQVIGLRILDRTDKTASLTADGKTALLDIEQPDDVVPMRGGTTGLYHYALLLPTRAHLARIVRHFAELGVRLGSSDHLVSEALYLNDPDGNGIEIYRDRDPSEWNWRNGEVDMAVDPLNFRDLLADIDQLPPWDGMPAETIMGHIHLHVSELGEAEAFYVNGLGFEVVNRFGSQALFISTGKYHHHIGLNTWNGVGAPRPAANSAGLKSFVLRYPHAAARDQAAEHLRAMGVSVTGEGGALAADDPSGNRVLLMA